MRLKFILIYILGLLVFVDTMVFGFLRLPFEITVIALSVLTWGASGFLLSNVKKGGRIFVVNLLISLLISLGYFFVSKSFLGNADDWKANLVGIEFLWVMFFVFILWGWILLLYAGMKRFR